VKRLPIGLIIASVVAFAILVALGVWQLDRLKETNANRAAVAALSHTPARPIEAVLSDPGPPTVTPCPAGAWGGGY
jgi:cytochrome oxidase assembly protein ShyY1